ncbi:MAG: hypothetical protein EYC68_04935 [Chloroflexota bacterium]|nr:MAG: hypothetical protein EYC68_04935 [Chloroflexota bacterium]
MEHGQAIPQTTIEPHRDPGDFVAEEARIKKAKPNYIGVFILLAILTAIEIGIVSLFHKENGNSTVGRVPILLGLTVAKGLLVILYYMHLKFDSRLYSIFFGAGVLAFALPMVIAFIFLMSPPQLHSVRAEAGEGGTGGEQGPTAPSFVGPPITFDAEGGEFYFKPDALAAQAGQGVRVTLTNVGSVEHTFAISNKPKSEDPTPWTTNDGKEIAHAPAGSTGKGSFKAPTPGEYLFYCDVPGHAQAGMVGTFTVQ